MDTLRFGVIKYKSLEDFKSTYIPFAEYIAGKCSVVPVFKIVSDTFLGFQLKNNEYDIGIFKPFPYLKAKTDFPRLEVFATHHAYGSEKYTGVLMVRKNSSIHSVQDLQGKNILFVKRTSTSGFRIPKGILSEHNIDIDSSLASYDFSLNHDSSLRALIKGEVDAIAIDKRACSSVDCGSLTILEEYEVPYNAYVFSPGLDNATKSKISNIMFDAHTNPFTDIFNNKLGIKMWVPCTDNNYNQLRRYLRQGRNKATVKIEITPTKNARDSLERIGDILPAFYDNLVDQLEHTDRFTVLEYSSNSIPDINILIEISFISLDDGLFQVKTRKNEALLNNTNVSTDEIQHKLPKIITSEILIRTPIYTELHRSNDGWFITYGLKDGIDKPSYQFTIILEGEDALTLCEEDIVKVTQSNIYFKDNVQFKRLSEVKIHYKSMPSPPHLPPPHPEECDDDDVICRILEWIVKDPWDKLGILLAILIVMGSFYFTFRKKRRFRHMLYQTNDLLKNYIEGKYKIDNQVIEQKERVNRSLESGRINENQFLILKQRIEEIETIIESRLSDVKGLSPDIKKEIAKILKDGIITEKEYSRLMLMLNQKKRN